MFRLRSTVTVVLAITIAIGGLTAFTATSAARQVTTNYPSGGLGLSLDDWDALYGPGEAGQSYMQYTLNDGMYFVGVTKTKRVVDYIERTWAEGTGVSLEDAQAEAESLLPKDAKFIESYSAVSARILYGTQVDRYQSRTIGGQLGDQEQRFGSNFVVIYHLEPATDSYDYQVARFMIMATERS